MAEASCLYRGAGRVLPWLALALFGVPPAMAAEEAGLELLGVRKIWDQAPHNGFPDLVRFGDQWLCAVREGSAHVSPDGVIRVIASRDGGHWRSVKLFTVKSEDLREFEFCRMPDGRLMLLGAGCAISAEGKRGVHTSYVSFSTDGENWTELQPVSVPAEDIWMKRAVAQGGRFLSVGYHCSPPNFTRLYSSADGVRWEVLVDPLYNESFPNEAALLPLADGRLVCLQRCDGTPATSRLGLAAAPYTHWTWRDLRIRTGRPMLIQLPDQRIMAPIRLLNPMRTTVSWLDLQAGTLTEALKLPSGGDGGYTGAVLQNDTLWVVYYSSHEGRKSSIYLAQVHIHSTVAHADVPTGTRTLRPQLRSPAGA